MTGAHCFIYSCATSRKHSGVRIFKIPAETDELPKKTREAWVSVITKGCVADESLRRQINSGNGLCVKNILGKNNISAVSILIFILIYLIFHD